MTQLMEHLRIEAVMDAAKNSGLLGHKSKRLGVRISPALLEEAKRQTGIQADSDLIEYALASLAVEDSFVSEFLELQGTVDPDLDLSF